MAVSIQNYFLTPWWGVLLRGIAALLFGAATIFWPGITIIVLSLLLGVFLLISGVFTMIGSLVEQNRTGMWWLGLVLGIIEVGVGIYLVQNTQLALEFFILLLGLTLVARGIFDVVLAFDRNFPPSLKIMSMVGSAISVVAGIIILLYPIEGSLAFVWVLGLYAILAGVISIALSFDVKAFQDRLSEEA